MIEPITDVPPGVTGLRATGKLSKADYTDVLEPALREGVAAGELRMLFVLEGFEGLEHGAWIEDAKTGLRAWTRDHAAWHRFALVTDTEWVARAMRAFAWLAPGEVRVFELGELADATAWVSG
jgi:hypothetical protein